MTFTKETPTKPGYCLWREGPEDVEITACEVGLRVDNRLYVFFTGVFASHPRTPPEIGGEWCRLVPAEEVEKAWDEAREVIKCAWGNNIEIGWDESRAKRVMEGDV